MAQSLYTSAPEDSCDCPIHRGEVAQRLPLGIDFADRVTVREIEKETAGEIYEAHHSYMPSVPMVNKVHHGIELDGKLVGAITYRHPLLRCIGADDGSRYGLTQQYSGEKVIEVNRICIGVGMKNLASCGLATSQDEFLSNHADKYGLLMTFIRIDHTGSMLRALVDKGWHHGGISTANQAGNREEKEIREWDKIRWLNELNPQPNEVQASFNSYAKASA